MEVLTERGSQRVYGARCPESRLLAAAQAGDQLASAELLRRYRRLVRGRARHYFLAGADRDDVTQEGMLGLLKAIRDYDSARQSSFYSFAELCVTRQIISAVKSSTRLKHTPLNGYVSLSGPVITGEGGEQLLSDMVAARDLCDPAELVIAAWYSEAVREGLLAGVSALERDVLRMYADGNSYREIADALGRDPKAVDNALQRVKRKLELQIRRCEGS